MAASKELNELANEVVRFRDARAWGQFHTLKNLMISLNLEAGELLEIGQWKTDAELAESVQTPAVQNEVADECGDILIYLLLICRECEIDLLEAARNKLAKNEKKYPIDKAFGSPTKYTKL